MRLECFKPTEDDWYPSYKLETQDLRYAPKLITVSYVELHTGQWRVCVWGADDLGMEKDYPADQQSQALNQFLTLLTWKIVNKKDLEEEGFVFA